MIAVTLNQVAEGIRSLFECYCAQEGGEHMHTSSRTGYVEEVGYFLYNGWYGTETDIMANTLSILISAHDQLRELRRAFWEYINQKESL